MTTVFSARGVSVTFGAVRAVSDVDLDVSAGEVVGLIGPNGAGKTTFIDAITGFVRYAGSVSLGTGSPGAGSPGAGSQKLVPLDGLKPHVRARRGLARTWQTVELFDDLTVRENLTVAARGPASDGGRAVGRHHRGGPGTSVDQELGLLDLSSAAEAMPWELTQAQRKRAGIARALVARPRLLCLDEPAAGLDSRQSRELGELLPAIAKDGTAILLVDHDMGLVLSACSQVVVLDAGKVIARGTPAQVRGDERVVAAYLGHSSAGTAGAAGAGTAEAGTAGATS